MMNCFSCALSCLVLLSRTLSVLTTDGPVKGSALLEDIVRYYGENGTISTVHLDNILNTIAGSGRPPVITEEHSSVNSKCRSASELLAENGLPGQSQLDVKHLGSLCPAILSWATLPACPLAAPVVQNTTDYSVWGYGFLAVTIINLSSLLGLALIPLTNKPYFPRVLTYFVGLAIGTLFSNAVLQLIPEALGFDPKSDSYVLKAVGIFGGFYLLYFTEKILKMVLKTEHQHGQCQSVSHQNGDLHSNGEVITSTSFGSDKASVTSDPVTEPEEEAISGWTCRWLQGERLSRVKTVAWMVSLSDALHNLIDGLAIGASFTVSLLTGFSTSIAIICEEFPHELGDFVILLNAGMSVPQAVFFNLLSAMSCYLGLVLGILVGSNFAPNVIFAFAGGMFLYIALADMFPEMNSIQAEQQLTTRTQVAFFIIQNVGLLTGFCIILLITLFAGDISLG